MGKKIEMHCKLYVVCFLMASKRKIGKSRLFKYTAVVKFIQTINFDRTKVENLIVLATVWYWRKISYE